MDFVHNLNSTQSSPFVKSSEIKFTTDSVAVCLNLFLFFATSSQPILPRCHHVMSFLIAHLAIICMLDIFLSWFNSGEEVILINVSGYFCGIVSFLKNFTHSIFFAHMVVTAYERLQSFSEENSSCSQRAKKLIFVIWSASILFILPTAGMTTAIENSLTETTKYNASNDEWPPFTCKSVELFGFWEVTVTYEALRFLVFYVGAGFYLLYASIKARSRLQFLVSQFNISPEQLKQHLRYNRIIYFYLFSFCTIQLPSETFRFYRRYNSNLIITKNVLEALHKYLFPTVAFYMHMVPLVSYFFLIRLKFPCAICFGQQPQAPANTNEQEDGSNMAVSTQSYQLATSSRIIRNVDAEVVQEEARANCEGCLSIDASTSETLF